MSMGGLFDIGTSAMRTAYTQLQTTGHNIANVNTPGYSRQEVQLASSEGILSGAGFVGRGVDAVSVTRRYDSFLMTELRSSTSSAAGDTARATQLGRLEGLFANTDFGVGAAIDNLTAAFGDLVNRPFDSAVRSTALSQADVFAERVRSLATDLDQMIEDVDSRVAVGVQSINSTLARIAELNDTIARDVASGHTPNDLLDQRDALINDINKQLQVTTFQNYDGTVSLFTPTGHGLVVGGAVSRLALSNDTLDPSKIQVVMISNGERIDLPRTALGNGELGGLMRFRDEDLDAARASLGQIAAGVAWAYNRQQALGVDSTGTAGAAIFAAGPPVVTQATDNTGTAAFTATVVDGAQLAASDYAIEWDGSAYRVTRLSDGNETSVGAWPATIDGLQIDLTSGTPQTGDRFLVRAGSAYAAQFETTGISPMRLATGYAATVSTGATNAGDVTASRFAVVGVDPNVAAPVTITFDGAGTFSVSGAGTGNPTGLAYTPGMTVSYNGWSMKLNGTPAAGDTVLVSPTADPAVDNRNARALLQLGDQGIVGGASVSNAYSNMLGDIGLRAQTAQGSAAMSRQRLADAKASVSEVSGVNLDEEAARLLQYQQAYQAAAKLMATAQTIFETLLQMTQ